MLAWVNRWALCLFDTSCREKDTGRRFQFPHPTISLKERRRGSAVTSGSPFPPPRPRGRRPLPSHPERVRGIHGEGLQCLWHPCNGPEQAGWIVQMVGCGAHEDHALRCMIFNHLDAPRMTKSMHVALADLELD